MLILATTTNFPDVMMPAFHQNPDGIIFFLVFLFATS